MLRSILSCSVVLMIALTACGAPTPTVTPVPPTATPVPPTASAVPPTATAVPPTATKAPTVAPTAAPAAESLIAEMSVKDATTASLWNIATNLQIGSQQFGDRSYYLAKLPEAYAGSDWVQTAMDAKNYTNDPLVTFKVMADADVYVAFDDRVVTKPAWFKDWVDTGDDIVNTEASPTTFSIFKKSFPANSVVTLGQNGQSKTCGQYMVFVRRPGQKPVVAPVQQPVGNATCKWDACLGMPATWYGTDEAVRIADNLLLYQRNTGGWYKNIDMADVLTDTVKATLQKEKSNPNDSTIDNNATTSQMTYLARVYNATQQARFKDGFIKGLDYLFAAQYANGGWPQYYPNDPSVYYARITYNDDALIHVMTLLRDVSKDPAYSFVDADRRAKAGQAVQKGIEVILKSQIVAAGGKKTAWCAQHDEKTLAPALARSYELPSISGQESVGIARYLMTIEKPSADVIDAIQSAIKWMDDSKILGIQVMDKQDPAQPGGIDRVVVANPSAPAIWGRFYDIDTNKVFFVGRDGVKKATLAEIEQERRVGYAYYTTAPAYLLANDYPAWLSKNGLKTVLSAPAAAPGTPTVTATPAPTSTPVPVSSNPAAALAAKKSTTEIFSDPFEKGMVGDFAPDWLMLDKDNHTTNKTGARVSDEVTAPDGKLVVRLSNNPAVDGQANRDFTALPVGRVTFYAMVPSKDGSFLSVELRDGGTRMFNLEMHPEGRFRYRDENGNLIESNVKFDLDKWYQLVMEWDAGASIWNGYAMIDGKQTALTPAGGVPFPSASKGKAPTRIQLRLNRNADGVKYGFVDAFKLSKAE